MNDIPILPKTFAMYVNPLKAGKNYAEGSDGMAGLSDKEAKRIKSDISGSSRLSKEEKADAIARVDKALEMTKAAKANDGKVDAKEMQAMLSLGKHELSLQASTKGAAVPVISLNGAHVSNDQAKGQFFSVAAGTSYAPVHSGVEGGPKDSIGKPLAPHTIDEYVKQMKSGKDVSAKYVAIAMDSALFKQAGAPLKYGDVFRIPELEKIYGVSPINFAVVDTGGAFSGAKGAKVDICSTDRNNPKLQQSLSLYRMTKPDGKPLNIDDLKLPQPARKSK